MKYQIESNNSNMFRNKLKKVNKNSMFCGLDSVFVGMATFIYRIYGAFFNNSQTVLLEKKNIYIPIYIKYHFPSSYDIQLFWHIQSVLLPQNTGQLFSK